MWNGLLLQPSMGKLSAFLHSSCALNSSNTFTKASWLKLVARHHGIAYTASRPSILQLSYGGRKSCLTREMATAKRSRTAADKQLAKKSVKGGKGQLTVGEKVTQAGKDTMYIGIVVVGIGVTILMFATVFKELFSSKSPNGVFTKALKYCLMDSEIVEELGRPIKGYGEETRRRRRRHVSHLEYDKDGVRYMRLKFYMKGSKRSATVNLEVKENDGGKYEYRYLFVELDGYPHKTIILEDNR